MRNVMVATTIALRLTRAVVAGTHFLHADTPRGHQARRCAARRDALRGCAFACVRQPARATRTTPPRASTALLPSSTCFLPLPFSCRRCGACLFMVTTVACADRWRTLPTVHYTHARTGISLTPLTPPCCRYLPRLLLSCRTATPL